MSKKRPVFSEAREATRPVFTPHHVGEQEYVDTGSHLISDEELEQVKTPEIAEDIIEVEEQITSKHEGWQVITLEQQNGKNYLVASTLDEEGEIAFWRKTRVLSHSKWILNGKWSYAMTRADVLPQPIYFKEIDNG